MNFVHSKTVRKPLVAIILSTLKCMFYRSATLNLPLLLQPYSPPTTGSVLMSMVFSGYCGRDSCEYAMPKYMPYSDLIQVEISRHFTRAGKLV